MSMIWVIFILEMQSTNFQSTPDFIKVRLRTWTSGKASKRGVNPPLGGYARLVDHAEGCLKAKVASPQGGVT
jgi:hypothetical protein